MDELFLVQMSLENRKKDLQLQFLVIQVIVPLQLNWRKMRIFSSTKRHSISETGNLAKEYGHSTIGDAARVAKEAGAKTLIANHISARFMPSDVAQLQKQGEAIFPALHIAEDFSRFEWKNGEVIRRLNM